jgi:hypothetical protein
VIIATGLAVLAGGCGASGPAGRAGGSPATATASGGATGVGTDGSTTSEQVSTTSTTATTTTTTLPPTTTTTTLPPATTTTTLPRDPQSNAYAASAAFMGAWERGDRRAALAVATPGAVGTLFAHRYNGEVLNDRGCSLPGPNPVICSWGPYALASPTNPLYEVTLRPEGSGWYVNAVKEETAG